MASHSSATAHQGTPHTTEQTTHRTVETTHVNRTSRTNTIVNALKRRAQAVLNDPTIDAQSRAVLRYALEINDPWLAELVRRAEEGELFVDTIDFSQTPPTTS